MGEFLHETLEISEDELGQNGIEDIKRVQGEVSPMNIHDEVVIVFKDLKKRDLMMASRIGRKAIGTYRRNNANR